MSSEADAECGFFQFDVLDRQEPDDDLAQAARQRTNVLNTDNGIMLFDSENRTEWLEADADAFVEVGPDA